jgi:DNA-binding MarR family transcriptional regulator
MHELYNQAMPLKSPKAVKTTPVSRNLNQTKPRLKSASGKTARKPESPAPVRGRALKPKSAPADGLTRSRNVDQGILEDLLGYNMRRAYLCIIAHFQEKMASYQLRPAEFSLLAVLGANSGTTPKQLAQALDIAPPNLVMLIDRMEKRGLVGRETNPNDRRSHALNLTESGRDLLGRAEKTAAKMELDGTTGLTALERSQLMDLLKKIYMP